MVIRNFLVVALSALVWGCGSDWEPAFDDVAAPGFFDYVALAKPDEALTFARTEKDGVKRLLAVTHYGGGLVRAVDLTDLLGAEADDPVRVMTALGYDGVHDLMRRATPDFRVMVLPSDLVLPVDLHEQNIAAAANFPEHAGEAGVDDGPFLFPKLVSPTGAYDPVPAGNALLDYEVEVALVTLTPLVQGERLEHAGLILCNDFTDRDTLLHALDPWDVESGDGFTTGKSFPGYLPVGNLFVVPRDFRRFVSGLELQLYVNDRLRQNSPTTAMVWDFDEIISRAWTWKDKRWDHRGAEVSLLADSATIPARTLILSGTPHGTVFAGLGSKHYIAGLSKWLLGGWNESVSSRVVSAYVGDARTAGAYLKPGDRVEIRVDRMGVLRNEIVP